MPPVWIASKQSFRASPTWRRRRDLGGFCCWMASVCCVFSSLGTKHLGPFWDQRPGTQFGSGFFWHRLACDGLTCACEPWVIWGDMALRRIKTLSGGQKSRVAMAIVTYRQTFGCKDGVFLKQRSCLRFWGGSGDSRASGKIDGRFPHSTSCKAAPHLFGWANEPPGHGDYRCFSRSHQRIPRSCRHGLLAEVL